METKELGPWVPLAVLMQFTHQEFNGANKATVKLEHLRLPAIPAMTQSQLLDSIRHLFGNLREDMILNQWLPQLGGKRSIVRAKHEANGEYCYALSPNLLETICNCDFKLEEK
jgi:hypothetical protein